MHYAIVDIPADLPPYTTHQYLYSYFPQHSRDQPRPFLFRQAGNRCLLLSQIAPACPSVEFSLTAGRTYAIEALLSPTRKTRSPSNKLIEIPITGNAARRAWFQALIERDGAQLGFCQWYDRPKRQFRHSSGDLITLCPGQVKAMLLITDQEAFIARLLKGFGRGKAFGYGMLYFPHVMERRHAAA